MTESENNNLLQGRPSEIYSLSDHPFEKFKKAKRLKEKEVKESGIEAQKVSDEFQALALDLYKSFLGKGMRPRAAKRKVNRELNITILK